MPALAAIAVALALAQPPRGEEQTSAPPPILPAVDVHRFGVLDRSATAAAWDRAKSVRDQFRLLFETDDLGVRRVDYWHADIGRLHARAQEAARICAIYDEIDNLALALLTQPEWPEIQQGRLMNALTSLYHLLGPADFYAGRVPPIPPEIFP